MLKILSVIFVIISLAYYFSWLHFIDSQQVKSTRENIQYCVYYPTSGIRARFYCLGIVVGVGLKMEESSGAAMIRLT